jgi:inorganic pyrophosphatase
MTKLEQLPTFGPGGLVHVVVEASRGMSAKCKYEPEPGCFVFGKPLPHGLAYPYDWGFIPSTLGGDGDPLDALVLHDAACPVGCLIRCWPVAVLEVEQHKKGKKHKRERNDRFLFRPAADPVLAEREMLGPQLKLELEQFFNTIALCSGKKLDILGWRGAKAALTSIKAAAR